MPRWLLAAMFVVAALIPVPETFAAGRCGDHPWCNTSLSPDQRATLLLQAMTQDEKTAFIGGDDLSGVLGGAGTHTGTQDGIPRLDVPTVYYSTYAAGDPRHPPLRLAVGQARGAFASIRGKLYRDVGLDAVGTRWTSPDLFRPQVEARTELFFRTQWLKRFPDGQFGFNATVIHEYRSAAAFPAPDAANITKSRGSHVLSTLIELHIRSAYISWQYRNITRELYAQVPGYLRPVLTNFYGVRWEFYN